MVGHCLLTHIFVDGLWLKATNENMFIHTQNALFVHCLPTISTAICLLPSLGSKQSKNVLTWSNMICLSAHGFSKQPELPIICLDLVVRVVSMVVIFKVQLYICEVPRVCTYSSFMRCGIWHRPHSMEIKLIIINVQANGNGSQSHIRK